MVDERRIRSIIDFKWVEDAGGNLYVAVLFFDLKASEVNQGFNPNIK